MDVVVREKRIVMYGCGGMKMGSRRGERGHGRGCVCHIMTNGLGVESKVVI